MTIAGFIAMLFTVVSLAWAASNWMHEQTDSTKMLRDEISNEHRDTTNQLSTIQKQVSWMHDHSWTVEAHTTWTLELQIENPTMKVPVPAVKNIDPK